MFEGSTSAYTTFRIGKLYYMVYMRVYLWCLDAAWGDVEYDDDASDISAGTDEDVSSEDCMDVMVSEQAKLLQPVSGAVVL